MRIRALLYYIFGLTAGWLLLASPAYAQQQDIFQNITNLLCQIARSLSGPIALAVGLIVVAGGGLALAVGGRRSLGVIVWGLIGVAVALGAATIIASAFSRAAC